QIELEVQFENLIRQTRDLIAVSDTELAHFKSTLVDCCHQYRASQLPQNKLLKREHLEAIKELRGNKDILITRPDKGDGIVIMNKSDYVEKLNNILSDRNKFQPLTTKDNCSTIEKQLTDCLKKLKNQNIISEAQLVKLKPTGTNTPRLYGLPKIHKQCTPLRPILDMSNSPYHSIAQWLAELLKPLQRKISSNTVDDTFGFIQNIEELNVDKKRMISLDVQSLFTNVPLLETVNYICDLLEKKLTPRWEYLLKI
ncbi:MAG: hypothetical protein ACRDDF_04915, partial [Aeromonas sp.]